MYAEIPEIQLLDCQVDIDTNRIIIILSGRMILEGLETLLLVLPRLKNLDRDWVLWIEGDGPELGRFQNLAKELNVLDRCRFWVFVNMTLMDGLCLILI